MTTIIQSIHQAIGAVQELLEPKNIAFLEESARLTAQTFANGNKVLIAGNGGSLCDAMHFAEELTGFFRKKRRALPAIALSDPGHITCTANDLDFESIFSRGIEAYGKPGDLFIGLTTSGNSPNIIKAFATAKALGLNTVSFLGKNGGALKNVADLEMIITSSQTSDRIQEAHMAAIHIIIERLEEILFDEKNQELDLSEVGAVLG
ncbi:MAG: SIS domain-containing protein [Waddliaceae bacterium]